MNEIEPEKISKAPIIRNGILKIILGVSILVFGLAGFEPVLAYYGNLDKLNGFQQCAPIFFFVFPLCWGLGAISLGFWDIVELFGEKRCKK